MSRLRLRGRITLYFSCLVLGLVASLFVVLGRWAEKRAHEVASQELRTTQKVFQEHLRLRYEDLTSRCRLLADSPRLIAAVDTHDPPTVLDIAQTLQEDLRSDLFTVTDRRGVVLARTDMPDLRGVDISAQPLIQKALAGEEDAGPLGQGGQLYQVASAPLFDPQSRSIIGTLSIGFRIDNVLAGILKQVTQSDIVFAQEGQITASTLPTEEWPEVSRALERVLDGQGATSEISEVRVGGGRYQGRWGDLSEEATRRTVGVYVILRSLEWEEQVLGELLWLLTALGSAGIATAVVASYLVARGLTRPIGRLATAAGRIAAGDLTARVESHASDEIGHLATDFNRMAESLRGSREALERLNEELEYQVAQRTEELAASLERIGVINRITNVISSSLDLDEIGRIFAQEVHRLTSFDCVSILLLSEDGLAFDVLLRLNAKGEHTGGLPPGTQFLREGTGAGWVVDHGVPLIRASLGEFAMDEVVIGEGMRSALQLPLLSKGKTLGVLNILSRQERAYSERDLSVLQPIVEQLSVAIEHSRLYRQEQMTVERLQEISRLKSEFLANMSHELRTPMNSIIGFAELMQNPAFGPLTPAQADYLDTILRNARHLLQLINDILDLSKIEAGKVEFHFRPFEVPRALEDAQVLIRSLAAKKGLKMTCSVPDGEMWIVADETKFKQIMYNLLSNAVKFTPHGGSVEITARRVQRKNETEKRRSRPHPPPSLGKDADHPLPLPLGEGGEGGGSRPYGSDRPGGGVGEVRFPESPVLPDGEADWLEVAVSDTGIGIRPEDQGRIFNAFEQVDGSYARHYEGTGLGLALTKRLVELQGGEIWVRSEVDRGSTFTFVLPMQRETVGAGG
jgi:signal transduction histidine kinase